MTHLDDGRLRAYLDEQLPLNARRNVDQHLATCARCQDRLAEMGRSAQRVALAMDHLAPQREPQVETALAHARIALANQPSLLHSWRTMMNRRVVRAIATGTVVLAMLIGVFSFAPTRALARQFLSVFRVRKFAVVQVNPLDEDMESVVNALRDTLMQEEPEIYVDEPATDVADVAEASAMAGFQVRMPGDWPDAGETKIQVKGRTEMGMQLGEGSLPLFFELAGMDPALVPDDLGDGIVRGMIPSMVSIENEQYTLLQVLDPMLEYPEGVDPALIGEAGLRIMGIGENEARRISQAIDWGNTLLLPVPTEMVTVRETLVNDHAAVLLVPADYEHDTNTLLWEADDVVNVLSGWGSAEKLLLTAESMYD